jgi:gluconolactonase
VTPAYFHPDFAQIVRPDARLQLLVAGCRFTEGPVWFTTDGGSLLFSDIPANRIYRWTKREGLTVWREPSNHANGHTRDRRGCLLTCEHGSRRVTRTDSAGDLTVLADSFRGRKLNSPNDLVEKSDGSIWFTDPPYGIKPEQQEQPACHVFRIDPAAGEPVVVNADTSRPNGICFSPDESLLYLADSGNTTHRIRRFRVRPDNTLTDGELFADIRPGVPDGIRCDIDGRLYVAAGDGVQIFDAAGAKLGLIPTPRPAANCTFGGIGNRTLFITAMDSVWSIDLAIVGAR